MPENPLRNKFLKKKKKISIQFSWVDSQQIQWKIKNSPSNLLSIDLRRKITIILILIFISVNPRELLSWRACWYALDTSKTLKTSAVKSSLFPLCYVVFRFTPKIPIKYPMNVFSFFFSLTNPHINIIIAVIYIHIYRSVQSEPPMNLNALIKLSGSFFSF